MKVYNVRMEYHYDRPDGVTAVERLYTSEHDEKKDAVDDAVKSVEEQLPGYRVYASNLDPKSKKFVLKIYQGIIDLS